MRLGRRHRVLGCCAGALLVLWTPGPAWCQEKADETERWVPAFAITSDILIQSADGSLQNSLRPPGDPNTLVHSSGSLVEPAVGGSLELMSPALLPLPGRPRLFVHGDLSAVFSDTVNVAREGSPGPYDPPPPVECSSFDPPQCTSPIPTNSPGAAVGGQGSRTTAEIDSLLVSAGAGIAFTIDVGERRLRLKPSFEYVREQVTMHGLVQNVTGRFICDGPGSCPPATISQMWDFTTLRASRSGTFNGIGAGLELEMDAVRLGPFMLTVFLDGTAAHLLGDRKLELTAGDPDPTTPCGSTACWGGEVDPWLYTGGGGLRFRFVPER